MRKIGLLFLIVFLAGTFFSCERRVKQDVLMVYPNWADGIAITYLAKVVLEDRGYTVNLKRLEPGPIFASLSRGDADVYMDAWLPNTHASYWERFNTRLDVLGAVFTDGVSGLVVPSYVQINSIDELNDHQAEFGGKIYGIAAGAGIFGQTNNAIKNYNLNFEQIASSETTMLTVLRKAIANKENIVITGWKPHYMWSKYDLKTLKDPLNTYPVDSIKIISRKNFSSDQPEIAKFYSNFRLEEKLLNELMDDVASDKDPEVGAKLFYNKHKDLISKF